MEITMNNIPLVKPFIPPSDVLMPVLEKVLYSGYIAEGESVYEFENLFRNYINNSNTLACSSGTAALHIALKLCNVSKNDEVISTALTAEPTNIAIAMTGAKVIWADINKDTGLIDPKSVESKITTKTKAIMLVDYAGMVCDLEKFQAISQKYSIPIIEDAAHALGSKYDNKYVGNISQYTIFSLQAIKHMTTVDGGFLSMQKISDMERSRRLRWFGLDKLKPRLENDITECGYKYNMNNVNATIGIVQMKYIHKIISSYIANGKFYDKELKNIPGVEMIKYTEKSEPSYWLYTMKVEKRDDFIKYMSQHGVTVSPLHLRNDRHSLFSDSKVSLPNLDSFYHTMIHIPCGWWVDKETRDYIVDTIKKGW
jgi:UDP-4-keto-6-deoxy-N-acetylglucosamine 4-aminotransferase